LPYVKICGLTSSQDVRACIAARTDALGFLVGLDYPSEDQISTERAAALVREVPPFVSTVLVTHRTAASDVIDLCRKVPVSTLQLHGEFPPALVPELRGVLPHLRIILVVHATGDESLERAKRASDHADAILVDTRTETRLGGTGRVHDWTISRAIRDLLHPRPLILAGGLDPGNVSAAIERVRPFGVDVNSGVSRRRGVKDARRVREFLENARAASA
jgi:phosphoribosylanthranilate isomerase